SPAPRAIKDLGNTFWCCLLRPRVAPPVPSAGHYSQH
ncbi:hypothetical protein A2U01_0115763, partial [Trifolium medium]|nr:hypothetical protein [Trifolium medium]